MNFTREPIIETVITPKDGYKLTIRSSRGGSQEQYCVDAIEVVSFGKSMFFRSQERPKSFLLPVTDYEVVETKDARVMLKNAPLEGSIKIGGGKVAPKQPQQPKEIAEDKNPAVAAPRGPEGREDRSRRRKGALRRRRPEEANEGEQEPTAQEQPILRAPMELKPPPIVGSIGETEKKTTAEEPPLISSTMFKSLFPPPPGLISDKLNQERANQEKAVKIESPVELEAPSANESKDDDDDSDNQSSSGSSVDQVEEKEEKKGHQGHSDTPRYHSAPYNDTQGPTFRLETNFVY